MTVPTLEPVPETLPEAAPEPSPDEAATPAPDAAPDAAGSITIAPELADGGAAGAGATAEADENDRRRRRRFILLAILGGLATLLVIFGLWYLIFRKPISEIIPPLALGSPPAYQTSMYGMTKPLGVAVTGDGSRLYVTQTSGTQETLVLDSNGTKLGVLAPPATVVAKANQLYVAINPKTGDIYATDRAAGAVYEYAADGTYKATFDAGADRAGWQPLGIAFDAKADLFVTDAGGTFQSVHEFGPDGAFIQDFGEAGLFSFPNGIAIDGAGNVYVADSNNGRLIVFDPAGKQVASVERGVNVGELGLPRGISIDDSGRVYVVDSVGQSVDVYRALQPGETSPQYLTRFGREGTVDGAFEYPNDVAVDSRGHLYVTDWNNDRLQLWGY